MKNIAYYIVCQKSQNGKMVSIGGHGYSYDPETVGKRSLVKNVATDYGYYVDAEYQNNPVNLLECFTGRSIGYPSAEEGFLCHIEKIITYHFDNDGSKLLITSNASKLTQNFINNKGTGEKFKSVYALYEKHKDNIIFDFSLFPKGGIGFKHASDQANFATALVELGASEVTYFDIQTEKDFNKPEIDFNKLISSSFCWFFNTGDKTTHYTLTPEGRRGYFFGKPEKKKYYGKATPDTCYSALFTKEPITLLDNLFEYCKKTRPNPLNYIAAGNLNYILSKEVGRMIDTLPGVFIDNKLMSPMKIASSEDPCIVEVLEVGLGYRIKDFCAELYSLYSFFMKRDTTTNKTIQFVDITDRFFTTEKNKLKLHPDFSQATVKITVPINSPDCVKPVKINLGIGYDVPRRNDFNAMIKDKIKDIKVYLALDFHNKAGVEYRLVIDTPEFTYLYSNSCANKRVYSVAELGRK